MLNPLAVLARHYLQIVRKAIPVEVRRDGQSLTIEVSERGHASPRRLTLFGSDAEVAVAHRAPGAWFSDEIRVRATRGPLSDSQRLRIPRWPSAVSRFRFGPLVILTDTAARQSADHHAFCADAEEHAARTEPPRTLYTQASRRIPDGTREQMEFDPIVTAYGARVVWMRDKAA